MHVDYYFQIWLEYLYLIVPSEFGGLHSMIFVGYFYVAQVIILDKYHDKHIGRFSKEKTLNALHTMRKIRKSNGLESLT